MKIFAKLLAIFLLISLLLFVALPKVLFIIMHIIFGFCMMVILIIYGFFHEKINYITIFLVFVLVLMMYYILFLYIPIFL